MEPSPELLKERDAVSGADTALLRECIERKAVLEVDLGCGKGRFLTGLAEQNPSMRFVGVERQADRVLKCRKKIRRMELQNAEVLCGECMEAVTELFPPESVDCFYVLFPDPWPKRRHHRRRLITAKFAETVRTRLKAGGILRLMTDDEPYFRVMRRVCEAAPGFAVCDWDQGREFPVTDFQKLFSEQGLSFHRIAIRRTG